MQELRSNSPGDDHDTGTSAAPGALAPSESAVPSRLPEDIYAADAGAVGFNDHSLVDGASERTLSPAAALAAIPVPAEQDDLPLKPVDVDGVGAVLVGTVVFALAFVVLLFQREQLRDAGHDWYLWTALAGFGLGLFGIAYTTSRRDAIATLRAAAKDERHELEADAEPEHAEPEHAEPEHTLPEHAEPEHTLPEHAEPVELGRVELEPVAEVDPEPLEPAPVEPEPVALEPVEAVEAAPAEPELITPEPAAPDDDGVGEVGEVGEAGGAGLVSQRGRRRRAADATSEQPAINDVAGAETAGAETAIAEAPPAIYTPRRGRRG